MQYDQASAVQGLFAAAGFEEIEVHQDVDELDRVVSGRLRRSPDAAGHADQRSSDSPMCHPRSLRRRAVARSGSGAISRSAKAELAKALWTSSISRETWKGLNRERFQPFLARSHDRMVGVVAEAGHENHRKLGRRGSWLRGRLRTRSDRACGRRRSRGRTGPARLQRLDGPGSVVRGLRRRAPLLEKRLDRAPNGLFIIGDENSTPADQRIVDRIPSRRRSFQESSAARRCRPAPSPGPIRPTR